VERPLKAKATALAWELLAELAVAPAVRVVGRADDAEVGSVRVVVTPPGATPNHRERHVGHWMSPTELLIVTKLGDETLSRVELAKRCAMACDPRFKALVTNLIDRAILDEPDEGGGVRKAPAMTTNPRYTK
jgi:hypothetical protein